MAHHFLTGASQQETSQCAQSARTHYDHVTLARNRYFNDRFGG